MKFPPTLCCMDTGCWSDCTKDALYWEKKDRSLSRRATEHLHQLVQVIKDCLFSGVENINLYFIFQFENSSDEHVDRLGYRIANYGDTSKLNWARERSWEICLGLWFVQMLEGTPHIFRWHQLAASWTNCRHDLAVGHRPMSILNGVELATSSWMAKALTLKYSRYTLLHTSWSHVRKWAFADWNDEYRWSLRKQPYRELDKISCFLQMG